MPVDSRLIERIVREVLTRLGTATTDVRGVNGTEQPAVLSDRVLTGDLLAERIGSATRIQISPDTLLTPTARDFVRHRKIDVVRVANNTQQTKPGCCAAIIVDSTPALERLIEDENLNASTNDCPDNAAEAAVNVIARGGNTSALLFAAWTHRCAMLANRHDRARAAVVNDASEIAPIRKLMRANIWCIDPAERSYFELRNIKRAIQS